MKLKHLAMTLCLSAMTAVGADDLTWPSSIANTAPWRIDTYSTWEADAKGTPVLHVDVPAETTLKTIAGGSLTVDLTPYRGKTLQVTVETKHNRLTKPSRDYLGFKLMLSYTGSDGITHYPGGGNGSTTPVNTDWRVALFTTNIDVAATTGQINLGCQDCTGELWFKNLRFKVIDMYKDPAPLPKDYRCEYSDAVRNMPRLRGCMSPGLTNGAKAEDLAVLASWGANVIRWQVNLPKNKEIVLDLAKVKEIFAGHLRNLDVHLPQLRRDGLHVIFDFHGVPGGRVAASEIAGTAGSIAGNVTIPGNHFTMFHEKKYLDAFVEMWEMVARHYKDEPVVVGYDLYNEPVQSMEVPFDYLYCQYEAAKAIRAIDSEKPIIIAANEWSSPGAFAYLRPLPLKNLIYQGHMYVPGSYTHQGVGGNNMQKLKENPASLKKYPGILDGQMYTKETLRKAMQSIRDFQLKYGARIYMGEFSAIRFAPGAAQYLDDLTDIFEEYGWDWTYHAFREWFNWSVEYTDDIYDNKPATRDTERKKVLLKHFRKNIKF